MTTFDVAGHAFERAEQPGFGLVIVPVQGATLPLPLDHLDELLLAPGNRAQFYEQVDHYGFVLCRKVHSQHPTYRVVRGRSSPGKLSPGEYFHHDGCAGPTKPRVVEIRFPFQDTPRRVATALAPFPDVVQTMFTCLPATVAVRPEFDPWHEHLAGVCETSYVQWQRVQALVMRAVRRCFSASEAREYLRTVDRVSGAYVHRWRAGDSLFIANENRVRTLQHRRAYPSPAFDGQENGNLIKRWPAEELAGIALPGEIEP